MLFHSASLLLYVGDLANAVRNRTGLRFGLYHSLYEWFNPVFIADAESNFTRRNFVEVYTLCSGCLYIYHNYMHYSSRLKEDYRGAEWWNGKVWM